LGGGGECQGPQKKSALNTQNRAGGKKGRDTQSALQQRARRKGSHVDCPTDSGKKKEPAKEKRDPELAQKKRSNRTPPRGAMGETRWR